MVSLIPGFAVFQGHVFPGTCARIRASRPPSPRGTLRLHGWFFEIETGALLAYDGAEGHFRPIAEADMPVAQDSAVGSHRRVA